MAETENCKQCRQKFEILAKDKDFYNKVRVPEPTLCPDCRQIRRLLFRNESTLYPTKSAKSGKDIVSVYSPQSKIPVYEVKEWWQDDWDALSYGRDFDFSKSFAEQYLQLQKTVPHSNVWNVNSENCGYVNQCRGSKDCYYSFSVVYCERCLYCSSIDYCVSCTDCYKAKDHCELVYEGVDVENCYNCKYVQECNNCRDCFLCYDCYGCKNCFGCVGLRDAAYHFFNDKLSKEEYEEKLKQIDLGSYRAVEETKKKFNLFKLKFPHRFARITNSPNSTGDYIINSKDVYNSFDVYDSENINYSNRVGKAKDYWDVSYAVEGEILYEYIGSGSKYKTFFSLVTSYCVDTYYSSFCVSCRNILGCVGLRNKQYCIFNKQYNKSDYDELFSKIVGHMTKTGEYGEFFAPILSPFGYNETLAMEFHPQEREATLKSGLNWQDNTPHTSGKETIKPDEIPDNIDNVPLESVDGQILACVNCKRNYKLVGPELEFYARLKIPIPRNCPPCRHSNRVHARNPRKLYHRKCMNEGCENEFETTYAPERKEKVYCESCYQKSII